MKINELEKELGLTRHTIRYYEKEGLFTPNRDDNGYRNYTDENIQTIKLIKFLRNLDISIDDVKLILQGQLNFQECLTVNQIHLEKQYESIKEVKTMVDFYHDKDIPLIPELEDIKITKNKGILGIHKTTNTVSLGRKLTRSLAIRQCFYALIPSIALGYILGMVFEGFNIVISVICFFLMIGFSFKQTSSLMLDNSMNQSIEFLSDGIRYYKFSNFIDNIIFFFAVLLKKDEKLMKYYSYSDIKQVEILVKRRYMRIGSPIAYEQYVADFHFDFNDGKSFYFFWPMILDDDARFIASIITNKVDAIIDKNQALYAMKNGINLNDYYQGKKILP